MISVRPKVAELAFHLYGRPLHPELFQIHRSRNIQRQNYEVQLHITSAGHWVQWRREGLLLTEVAASAQHPLPEKRRLMNRAVKGAFRDHLLCRGGVQYDVQCELERVSPEMFWAFHNEMTTEATADSLLHRFDASGRVTLGALSYIHVEARSRSLLVQSFHTFPDDHAIVKVQSRFLLPNASADR